MTSAQMSNLAKLSIYLFLVFLLFIQVQSKQLYGIAYSPYRRFGYCPTRQELDQDNEIGILYTNRIRLYSTECHLLNDVYLGAASDSSPKHAHLEVLMGIWLDKDHADNAKEIQDLYLYLRKYPHARLSGIAVGNEVLYRNEMSASMLVQKVIEVKATVRQIAAETGSAILQNVPVFSVDVIPDRYVVDVSDAVGVNIHPFYQKSMPQIDNVHIMSELALKSAIRQINLFRNLYPGKEIFVTETGWPTNSAPHEPHRGNLQVSKLYMQKFSAWAKTQNVKYWWFQLFDSHWKKDQYPHEPPSMSEFNWGMYSNDRHKK